MKVVWRQDSNAMATHLHTNKSTSTGFLCMSRKLTYNLLSCNLNHTKHFVKAFHNQTADMLLNPSPAAMTQHFKLPPTLHRIQTSKTEKPSCYLRYHTTFYYTAGHVVSGRIRVFCPIQLNPQVARR